MSYAEVTIIVNGALEEVETFHDESLMNEYIESMRVEIGDHAYPSSIDVRYHEHADDVECECSQYETDHTPAYEYSGAPTFEWSGRWV